MLQKKSPKSKHDKYINKLKYYYYYYYCCYCYYYYYYYY